MAKKNQKLELTWVGKDKRPKLEPRILIEDPEKSYHVRERRSEDDIFDNILIHGDNLLALKALEQDFSNKIKCVCIDPPYNTGSAFSTYEDGLEHSVWLGLISERIRAIWNLLHPTDGSLWVFCDDHEAHYLKVICDEIFGRGNFVQTVIWQRKSSPANDAKYFSNDHDYIFCYAKNKESWPINRFERSDKENKYYTNPDNDTRGPWNSATYTGNKSREERPNLYYAIVNPNTGEEVWPERGLTWRFAKERHLKNETEKLLFWGKDGKSKKPRLKKFLSEAGKVVPRSVWLHSEAGHTQSAMTHSKQLFEIPFPTPKSEEVIQRIVSLATKPGDWLLDSFAGSGTSGAVAHKMQRRWIMVELGSHCETYVAARLKKVIDGNDPGGVTKAVNWKRGGGYRFYLLAPSLLEQDKYGNWVISKDYKPEMLAEAMCKHMGFTYAPSQNPDEYWNHGYSTETDFIFVTTQNLTHQALAKIAEDVGPDRSLLICCKAFNSKPDSFESLTIKKIPHAVLKKCEWGHDDYSLNVANLPMATDDDEEYAHPSVPPDDLPLFAAQDDSEEG